jgi:hypothetical protein
MKRELHLDGAGSSGAAAVMALLLTEPDSSSSSSKVAALTSSCNLGMTILDGQMMDGMMLKRGRA